MAELGNLGLWKKVTVSETCAPGERQDDLLKSCASLWLPLPRPSHLFSLSSGLSLALSTAGVVPLPRAHQCLPPSP